MKYDAAEAEAVLLAVPKLSAQKRVTAACVFAEHYIMQAAAQMEEAAVMLKAALAENTRLRAELERRK